MLDDCVSRKRNKLDSPKHAKGDAKPAPTMLAQRPQRLFGLNSRSQSYQIWPYYYCFDFLNLTL